MNRVPRNRLPRAFGQAHGLRRSRWAILLLALSKTWFGCEVAAAQPHVPPGPPSCDHWAGYGGGLNGVWSDPGNWQYGFGVPNSNFDACIQNGISNVQLDVSATVQRLWIDPLNTLTSVPGVTLTIAGGRNPPTLANDGLITLNSSTLAFSADALISTDRTIPPATIQLNGSSIGGASGATLTLANNIVQGYGSVGNGLILNLQQPGEIIANSSGNTLIINGQTTNQTTLSAQNGGILQLASTINNSAGTISTDSSPGSVVLLANGTIQGGTLSGDVQTLGGGTLDGQAQGALNNNGSFTIANNSVATMFGTINNTGTILLNSTGGAANLIVGGNGISTLTLTGGGTVTLTDSTHGGHPFIYGGTLDNVNNVIQGEGEIGRLGGMVLKNEVGGTINANVNGQTLLLDPNAGRINNFGTLEATGTGTAGGILRITADLYNAGTLQALNGGTVLLYGTTVNNNPNLTAAGGLIYGGANSVVLLGNATIEGGTLMGNVQTLGGATLDGYTQGALNNPTTFTIANNSAAIMLGTINNTGTILLNSTGNGAELIVGGNGVSTLTLKGGGTVTLTDSTHSGHALIFGGTLDNVDNVIQGEGDIGRQGSLILTNEAGGTILANANHTLFINATGTLTNLGTLQVNPGSSLVITSPLSASTFNSATATLAAGTYVINGGSGSVGLMQISALGNHTGGEIVNNAANIVLNGPNANTLFEDAGGHSALTPLAGNSGSLTVTGGYSFTTVGSFSNTGTVNVGSASTLSTGAADYSQDSGSTTLYGLLTTGNYNQNAGTTTIENGGKLTITGNLNQNGGTVDLLPGGNIDPLTWYLNGGIAEIDGKVIADVIVASGAELLGTGTITGNLTYAGLFSPGSVGLPGSLTVNGDFVMSPSTQFIEQISGVNNFGLLTDLGSLILGGTLDVRLLNFMPTIGEEFSFIDSRAITGAFSTLIFPNLGPNEEFIVEYNAANVELCAVSPSNPVCGAPPPSGVPEPGSIALLGTVGAAVMWYTKRRSLR